MVESTREFSRIPLRLEVQLLLEDGSEVFGNGVDLSLKGAFCETEASPPVGTPCTVALTFDSGDNKLSFYAAGRIARVADHGLAVEFTELELESFHHLRNLIRFNAPDPEAVDREFETHVGLKPRDD
jgi:hypothetical protein